MREPLSHHASDEQRAARYDEVLTSIEHLIEGEDWISAMATVSCELHHAFEFYHWTGFYRHTSKNMLSVGPYQGVHGCLSIPFARGVCGAAARTRQTQLVPDVHAFPGHIACSSETRSEIVVPVLTSQGEVLAVIDADSNNPEAFNHVDQDGLERLARRLGEVYGEGFSLS